MIEVSDAEIDRLQAHRPTLDHASIAEDRRDALAAARFDTGHEAELARRYELAAARKLSRTLRDLPRAETLGATEPPAEAEPTPGPTLAPAATPGTEPNPLPSNDIPAPLGSFREVAAATVVAAESAPSATPVAPVATRRPVSTVAFTPPRAPDGR